MRVAVIGQPGQWSTERLSQALRKAGVDAPVVDLAACSLELPAGRLLHGGKPLPRLDGAIVKKIGDTAEGWTVRERIHLLRHLEASGIPVRSRPDRLEAAVDRYRMTVELAAAGLPVPGTGHAYAAPASWVNSKLKSAMPAASSLNNLVIFMMK